MTTPSTLDEAWRWYAEDLRATAPVLRCPTVVEAFAAGPRERFLGPGPWRIHPRRWEAPPHTSATDHLRELCHDVLVSIGEGRDLNNGQPSLWAFVFDQLGAAPGETVLPAGTGFVRPACGGVNPAPPASEISFACHRRGGEGHYAPAAAAHADATAMGQSRAAEPPVVGQFEILRRQGVRSPKPRARAGLRIDDRCPGHLEVVLCLAGSLLATLRPPMPSTEGVKSRELQTGTLPNPRSRPRTPLASRDVRER